MTHPNLDAWFSLLGDPAFSLCEELLDKVQTMRDSGKSIYPVQEDILNALRSVAPSDVRVVIIGQDPYHEPGQAMGLSFSVPAGVRIPPSLRNIFKELHSDLGCHIPAAGDLTAWTRQGVLLLNTVLTVEAHRANAHKRLGWERFTNGVLRVVSRSERPVVYLCWGRQAHEVLLRSAESLPEHHLVICSTHPSPLSANRATQQYPAFISSRPFGRVNDWLTAHGEAPVDWRLG